ncbi:hypothetical protein BYT27DRAFT_7075836, partial [Phlegmacium glaucopus]
VDSKEGDMMHSATLTAVRDDSRDATFIHYEMLVDIHERQWCQKPEYQKEMFYRQLQHLFLITFTGLNAQFRKVLGLNASVSNTDIVIMAAIWSCHLEKDDPSLVNLNIHFYLKMGPLHVIDITSVQGLVGHVKDGERGWAIVNHSSSLLVQFMPMPTMSSILMMKTLIINRYSNLCIIAGLVSYSGSK